MGGGGEWRWALAGVAGGMSKLCAGSKDPQCPQRLFGGWEFKRDVATAAANLPVMLMPSTPKDAGKWTAHR